MDLIFPLIFILDQALTLPPTHTHNRASRSTPQDEPHVNHMWVLHVGENLPSVDN